jgi:hypothetical protein
MHKRGCKKTQLLDIAAQLLIVGGMDSPPESEYDIGIEAAYAANKARDDLLAARQRAAETTSSDPESVLSDLRIYVVDTAEDRFNRQSESVRVLLEGADFSSSTQE